MDTSQLQLRNIHLPEPISWWPLAYGWWLLLLLIIITVGLGVWRFRHYRTSPRRYALRVLAQIDRRYQASKKTPLDQQQAVVECNVLLKRTALSLYPQADIARLSGEDWIQFLKQHSKNAEDEIVQPLVLGPYQALDSFNADIPSLITFCRQWIRQAKAKANDGVWK
ncbi:DUF4381 domain-containing protein [Neptunomonas sp.]|uniref:DUF4381 domain-containing protein n=1 Tax=Neptunomonas TaxID=75687 RepID=UPI00351394E0